MHPPSLDNLHLSTKALLLCPCVCADLRSHARTLAHAHCRVPLAQCYCHNPTPSPLSFSFLFFMRNGEEVWNTELYFTCLKMTLLHKLIYNGELYLFVWPHHQSLYCTGYKTGRNVGVSPYKVEKNRFLSHVESVWMCIYTHRYMNRDIHIYIFIYICI